MAYNIIISTNERRLFDDVLERRPRCRGDVHERDRLCSAAPSTIRASSRSPLRAWSHWKPQAILTSPRSYARTRSKSRLRQRRHARDDGPNDETRRNDGTATALINHHAGKEIRDAVCDVVADQPHPLHAADAPVGRFIGIPILEPGAGHWVDSGFTSERDHDVHVTNELRINECGCVPVMSTRPDPGFARPWGRRSRQDLVLPRTVDVDEEVVSSARVHPNPGRGSRQPRGGGGAGLFRLLSRHRCLRGR